MVIGKFIGPSEILKEGYPEKQHPKRKITFKQAQEIRAKYQPRKYTMYALSIEYGISEYAVWRIIHGKTYTR